MTIVSVLFCVLFYAAGAILAVGVGRRVLRYARTPAPLKIPTTPAPTTRAGVVLRMLREVVLFESLFKANLWTWLFGWVFHAALLLVLVRHLRYFLQPVWSWVVFVQPAAALAGLAMVAGMTGLWVRRFSVDRVRFISTPSDHLMLALLMAIGISGLVMKTLLHTDIVGVKTFFLGLVHLQPQELPQDALLYLHLGLVVALMAVFPVSKLLHAPGVFFSPTRNQVDDPRGARHLAPWAAALDAER